MAEERELELNRETVRFVIDKAREFQVQESVTITEDSMQPSDDWTSRILADHGDDPTFMEFKSTIDDLEPDQQVTLVALMWVGRGDFTVGEWDDAIERAKDAWNTRTAEYLIGTPLVADYLAEGLEQFPDAES